jgi:hypothetical protein
MNNADVLALCHHRMTQAANHRLITGIFTSCFAARANPESCARCKIFIERRMAPSGFFDQSIFYKADGHRDNCAGDAAAHQLPGRGSDVEAAAAGGRAERRYQALQDGSANPAAGRPCNRFDEGAQVDIFKKSVPPIFIHLGQDFHAQI